MKKSSAFTLAEVLITLGIIGVVAAMTIPNLIANTNGAKYRSGFKKAISTLSQAGLMAQAQYDFDYAGTSTSNATNCGSAHPESNMTFCAILNGTLTGQTFRGRVSNISTQKNSASGTTFISHDQAEWTPDQYTDQVTYIKYHTGHKQKNITYNMEITEDSQYSNEYHP
jgi:prepilin-type N-terminal cleavage/methylation domain-containing protein